MKKEIIIQTGINSGGQIYVLTNKGRIFIQKFQEQKVQINDVVLGLERITSQWINTGEWFELTLPKLK